MVPAAAAAAGDLDPSFGTGGKVLTPVGGAQDVALLPNGKIVAAGYTRDTGLTGGDFTLARYLPDGSLDPVFAGDGTVTTDFGNVDRIYGLAIQQDGKIVAAGYTRDTGFTAGDFVVARYKRDGSLDPSFGAGGAAVTDLGGLDLAYCVALQSDGKIVVAGLSEFGGGYGLTLVRYQPNGSLDTSFGTGGVATMDLGYAWAVAIQPDGRIVASSSDVSPLGFDFALARFNPDGSADTSFGGDGNVSTDFLGYDDFVYDLAIQPDGKIVAVGQTTDGDGSQAFALARYNPDGSLDARGGDWPLDSSFDVDGKVTTTFEGDFETAWGVALQSNGKIVAVGRHVLAGGHDEFAIARYEYDGSLDVTFGANGRVNTNFGTPGAAAYGVAVQGDGGIVTAGYVVADRFGLTRYLGDPTSPPGSVVPPGVP